jgi:hypothetical protein
MSAKKIHGMTNSIEFNTWHAMKSRCLNSNAAGWKYYGGRGIKVCDRWINSFENFYKDMGPRPSIYHSIERLDVNGNYERNNCVWATDEEQANNKQNTIYYKDPISGEMKTARSLYNENLDNIPANLSFEIFQNRLRYNWSIKNATETPVVLPSTYLYQGKQMSLSEIGRLNNVEGYLLRYHINRGMNLDEALNYLLHGNIDNQAFTHSKHNLYTYQGKQYTLKGLSKFTNIKRNILSDRLYSGMSVEDAVNTPVRITPKYTYKGKEYGLMELLSITNIPRNTLMRYLAKGLSVDESVDIYYKRIYGK